MRRSAAALLARPSPAPPPPPPMGLEAVRAAAAAAMLEVDAKLSAVRAAVSGGLNATAAPLPCCGPLPAAHHAAGAGLLIHRSESEPGLRSAATAAAVSVSPDLGVILARVSSTPSQLLPTSLGLDGARLESSVVNRISAATAPAQLLSTPPALGMHASQFANHSGGTQQPLDHIGDRRGTVGFARGRTHLSRTAAEEAEEAATGRDVRQAWLRSAAANATWHNVLRTASAPTAGDDGGGCGADDSEEGGLSPLGPGPMLAGRRRAECAGRGAARVSAGPAAADSARRR